MRPVVQRHCRVRFITKGLDGGTPIIDGIGLSVVAEIAGEAVAQAIQLGIEYDPDPPFGSGHPDRASDAVRAAVFPRYEEARTAILRRYRSLIDTVKPGRLGNYRAG